MSSAFPVGRLAGGAGHRADHADRLRREDREAYPADDRAAAGRPDQGGDDRGALRAAAAVSRALPREKFVQHRTEGAPVCDEHSARRRCAREVSGDPTAPCRWCVRACRPHECRPLSAASIRVVHAILSGAFGRAVRNPDTSCREHAHTRPPTSARRTTRNSSISTCVAGDGHHAASDRSSNTATGDRLHLHAPPERDLRDAVEGCPRGCGHPLGRRPAPSARWTLRWPRGGCGPTGSPRCAGCSSRGVSRRTDTPRQGRDVP